MIEVQKIKEILHFTTNSGLNGVAHKEKLLSRQRLRTDETLEYILKLNTKVRYDPEWLDYVNLSISAINSRLFDISSRQWHANTDWWWCVLAFSPAILTHQGVWFATTNNRYEPDHGDGPEGLEALFAEKVHKYGSCFARRWDGMPDNLTTCNQAEVLYPQGIPTAGYLQRIYVATDDHASTAAAILAAQNHEPVEIVVQPSVFA